jgi:hypothetical protein
VDLRGLIPLSSISPLIHIAAKSNSVKKLKTGTVLVPVGSACTRQFMLWGLCAFLATSSISYNRNPSHHQFKRLEAMATEMEVAAGPFDCLDNQVSK